MCASQKYLHGAYYLGTRLDLIHSKKFAQITSKTLLGACNLPEQKGESMCSSELCRHQLLTDSQKTHSPKSWQQKVPKSRRYLHGTLGMGQQLDLNGWQETVYLNRKLLLKTAVCPTDDAS